MRLMRSKIFAAFVLLLVAVGATLAAAPQPSPKFLGLDSAGAPLVGGKLYSYSPGTSTLKNTFSDYNLTTPNTNPVVLDSRGEASVYLQGTTKLILKDSNDVTIWTVDNVQPTQSPYEINVLNYGASGSQTTVDAAITAIGASEVTLVFPSGNWPIAKTFPSNVSVRVIRGAYFTGTGTITFQGEILAGNHQIFNFSGAGNAVWSAYQRPNIRWWGTDGAAINAAILAVNAGTTKPIIYAPAGTYTADVLLNYYYRTQIDGDGAGSTIFNITGNHNGIASAEHLQDPTSIYDFTTGLSNLTLDASSNANNIDLIYFNHKVKGFYCRNVIFRGNSAASQTAIHAILDTQKFVYAAEFSPVVFWDINGTNGAVYGQLTGTTGAINTSYFRFTVNGTYQRIATLDNGEGNRFYFTTDGASSSIQTPIDATGAAGGKNPYFVFGSTVSTTSSRNVVEYSWMEGATGYVVAITYNGNVTSPAAEFIENRTTNNKNQIWDINRAGGTALKTFTSNTQIIVSGDLSSFYKDAYTVYFKCNSSNWYSSTCNGDSTYNALNDETTITINDTLFVNDLEYIAPAYAQQSYVTGVDRDRRSIKYISEILRNIGTFQTLNTRTNNLGNRTEVTAKVLTTDASLTSLYDLTLSEGYSYAITANVIAWQTGGSAGTIGDSYETLLRAGAKRLTGGAAALLTGAPDQVSVSNDGAFAGVATIIATGNNIRVRVNGEVNKNITWYAVVSYTKSAN